MYRLLAVCAVLAFATPTLADDKDKPKPNTLTPKEIAEGWVLLFDGETTFGWKIEGAAEVKDGVLILGKDKKTTAQIPAHFGTAYEVRVEFQGKGIIAAGRITGNCDDPVGGEYWGGVDDEWDGNKRNASRFGGPGKGSWGFRERKPDQPPVKFTTDGKNVIHVRNVKLRPLNTTDLFTGKNLDGWKVNAVNPKRMSSEFEVTKAGELSVKNGPGDLVTEKEFDNFVLQLECKTLGKALNSGIFFRCIPGQYQNGYEAQIQNAYKENDRTKPVDFGTGAIYRRIAARKVVSNDNEWFTMTVVADGKHFATWVNGYQTVDWIDDRKENENPRNGYRAAKGPISIQGHDPTTDLLFRNIRIVELPAEKK
ncbi:MAG: DUF1080 domain-containing protein [Planctomycetia bacterium]|nr:DUF1080 domain-containing protein [Planctomycetia bacterium]